MTIAELDLVAQALPSYEVGGQIGQGGFGVVLAGRHKRLDRPVAIKEIPREFAIDPDVRKRFVAEARVLASTDHPHVVPVFDYVEHEGLCLLVMELLTGGTVWSRFTEDGFDAPSAVAVALACAAGLQSAHDRGILHRDIKPENLMFSASGALKVTDFGIAKMIGGNETLATKAGDIIGTPSYIAPEQAQGHELSPATDVYALATMLYELLSGVLPFPRGGDAMAMLFRHAFELPDPLTRVAPDVPFALAEIVMHGLATDPADRYASAETFGIALAEAATHCWGTGWLAAPGIPVLGADRIVSAAGGTVRTSPAYADSDPTRRTPPPANVAPVRPSILVREPAFQLSDIRQEDLVPVQSVIKVKSARVPFAVAAVFALLAMVVPFIGLGAATTGGDLRPGTVTIAGVDPSVGGPVTVDLTAPLVVTTTDVGPADTVRVALQVGGVPVGEKSAPLVATAPNAAAATVPPLVNPYLVAGQLTGELFLTKDGVLVANWRFLVHTEQRPTTTAAAVAVALVALFGVAYLESFVRSLVQGRRRISGSLGIPASTALLAATGVCAVWILKGHEPTPTALVSSATLGLVAGIAATVGAGRIGARRRLRARTTSR